ncbi:MAG TPA: MmcQ/YjbR family DNA-binding protein [Bryobacteraceae bacterium]|jgi:phosphoribosylglycinamide formyltransferase-1|nr:MmcQ/YjbR family DNA-binding protein [Bryobacteraceae bacterium]
MPKRVVEDSRLKRVTEICLALPEAEREYNGRHAAFRIRKRVFAYYLNDHHGDGIVAISCKVLPGDNAALASSDPKRFYLPAYIGPRGWVALRLDVGEVDWDEVKELVTHSYALVGPKRSRRGAPGDAAHRATRGRPGEARASGGDAGARRTG